MLTILVATLIGMTQQPDPTIELLKADRDLAATSRQAGLDAALAPALAERPVLLLPGAPVLRGRTAIVAALAQDSAVRALSISWNAQAAWVSLDGSIGVTAGTLTATQRMDTTSEARHGSYIAGWRHEDGRWKLAALMQAGLVRGDRLLYDPAWGPKELPPLRPYGPARSIIEADLEFSARAGAAGAGTAFETFAAPDAVVFSGSGARRGPRAIGEAIGQGGPADWSWAPVVAEIAGTGDLGYTVGQAVIAPKSGGPPAISKYLTVWRRQSDGSMRFLTDGGNARPAP